MKAKILKLLSSPLTLVASMALGILIALYAKALLPFLASLSDIYLALLQMCVIPLVVCAVTVNIGTLLRSENRACLYRWLLGCALSLLLATVLFTGVSWLSKPILTPTSQTQALLSDMANGGGDISSFITKIEFYREVKQAEKAGFDFMAFLYSLFPSNIFSALAENDMLQILMFFLILGVVLALMPHEKTKSLLHAFSTLYEALCNLIGYLLIPFPIAMTAMVASQFSGEGAFLLIGSLVQLVAVIVFASLIFCFVIFLIIQWTARRPARDHLHAIKRTLFIAAGTGSCLATVAVAMEDCIEHLKIKPEIVRSVLPIGITMCQPGVAGSIAVAAVYGAIIYNVPMTAATFLLIVFCSVIFSLAVIGVPGIVAVSMMTIVLDPLAIPSGLIITIYLSIVPIINPFAVFSSVYANFAIASGLDAKGKIAGGAAASSGRVPEKGAMDL